MDLNFTELEAKAAEQSEARAEAFRKNLEVQRENSKNEKLQHLLNRAGEKSAADTRATMEAQVDTAIKHAEAEIRAEYAQKHGVVEYDDQREPLRKMLGHLMNGK